MSLIFVTEQMDTMMNNNNTVRQIRRQVLTAEVMFVAEWLDAIMKINTGDRYVLTEERSCSSLNGGMLQ